MNKKQIVTLIILWLGTLGLFIAYLLKKADFPTSALAITLVITAVFKITSDKKK